MTRKRAHKRKRKIILPKNFDPKVPPDPERWLPKQERSAYKKKLNKKHRDRDIGRGTQGAVSSASQMYVSEKILRYSVKFGARIYSEHRHFGRFG